MTATPRNRMGNMKSHAKKQANCSEKLQNILEIGLKRCGLVVQKSLSEKKYFEIKNLQARFCCLVYVIGLHAVQFGNNWMRKIPRTAKFGSPRNFLNPIISKLDKHVVLLPINYRAVCSKLN